MHRFLSLSSPRAFLLLLPLLALTACKPRLLPDTSVRDTKDNRAVIEFLKLYKKATESRSVQEVMALVADDYFENGTRFESNDKYGYSQLADKLTQAFEKTEAITLTFYVQNIQRKGRIFEVVYYFVERALIKYPSEARWMSANDVNRVVLRMKGSSVKDGFEIVSGL
jgi:hypothetical protein